MMSDVKSIVLVLTSIIFLLVLTSQVILLYAAYFKLDQLEKHFSSSLWLRAYQSSVGNGLSGRMSRLREIGTLMGHANHLRILDPDLLREAEHLPRRLKRWVAIPNRLMFFACGIVVFLSLSDFFLNLRTAIASPVSDTKLVFIALWTATIFLFLMITLVRCWLGVFKLEEFEFYLENVYFIGRNRRVLGNGVFARLCRLTHISLMLKAGKAYLLTSDAQAISDIQGFPDHLRCWLEVSQRLSVCSFFGLIALWGLGKATGLLG